MAPTTTFESAQESLRRAIDFSFSCQQSDGHWCAPVSADATFTAQYVMFKYSIPGLSLDSDGPAIKQWLFQDQKEDGSWGLAPTLPGNVSTSVEAYLALRLLDVHSTHPAMIKAKEFILSGGGVAKVRFFTRFFLATFGLFPWSAIPQMPTELILMPRWAKLNIYVLSSWARSTLIPILVVRHHEPVYPLPNGFGCSRGDNDFLDEIWCDPSDKNVPITRDLWVLAFGRDRDAVELFFTVGDKILTSLGGLARGPQRRLALDKCIEWLLSHQEKAGDWAGFFPPMHGSIWALLLEGYSLDDKEVRLGLEALERLAVTDNKGKWLQSTVSPCWDTALMANALCDAGFAQDKRVVVATEWLKSMQLMVDHGDWRVYSRNTQPGGWSFEYHNTFYPDVDDTAVVVMTLVKQDPNSINSECVTNALEWILGMQNHDGGWGAFDTNNDARWLHKIPFSDMDSLVDPSTSDVTGRMLECFGLLLSHRKGGHVLASAMRNRLQDASGPALQFLIQEQEACGAWWGRWGNNFNYGTTNVLRGLVEYCHKDDAVLQATKRAVEWLEGCQNIDGGWGEDLLSYMDPSLAGQGSSTAAQTAWALDSLLRYRPVASPAIQRGVRWLVENQTVSTISKHKLGFDAQAQPESIIHNGASWPIEHYVGTGFPNVLYLGYPFYHHLFPIQALSRFLDCVKVQTQGQSKTVSVDQPLSISRHSVARRSRPNVLMMVLGSRGDIEIFLSIANRLTECNIRIATHPVHQAVVEKYGFEFYDVGGSPDEFSRVLKDTSNILSSAAALRRSLRNTFQGFLEAGLDGADYNHSSFADSKILKSIDEKNALKARGDSHPFVADIVVSSPASNAHVHVAERLGIPLVIVSAQPTLPTKEFPQFATMTKSSYFHDSWLNYLSYFFLDLLNWLAFGNLFSRLRSDKSGMNPFSWIQATRDILHAGIPHICLWSSHVLPIPSDWTCFQQVTIPGYTSLNEVSDYKATESLRNFILDSKANNRPLAHISFGSMHLDDPTKLMATLTIALNKIQARAIVTRTWSTKWELDAIPQNLYITDSVPHSWLLPQVDGFVHHGGAGHTAAGMRASVPQMIIPFFLDQYLWASRVRELGLGPAPMEKRIGDITPAELSRALEKLLYSENRQYKERCVDMAKQVSTEGDGAEAAADEILRQLGGLDEKDMPSNRCCLLPDFGSHWRHKNSGLQLSSAATACLVDGGILSWDDLDLVQHVNWAQRWQDASVSRNWLVKFLAFVSGALTKFLGLVAYILNFDMILSWTMLWRGKAHTNSRTAGQAVALDPVRQARVRQGKLDLSFLRINSHETYESGLDHILTKRWQALTAEQFHHRMVHDAYYQRR